MRMLIAVCWCFFIGKMMIIHFNHLKIYVIFRDDQTPIGCSCSSIYPYFSWWDLQVLIMISFQTCLLANPSLFIANLTHQPISFFSWVSIFHSPLGLSKNQVPHLNGPIHSRSKISSSRSPTVCQTSKENLQRWGWVSLTWDLWIVIPPKFMDMIG